MHLLFLLSFSLKFQLRLNLLKNFWETCCIYVCWVCTFRYPVNLFGHKDLPFDSCILSFDDIWCIFLVDYIDWSVKGAKHLLSYTLFSGLISACLFWLNFGLQSKSLFCIFFDETENPPSTSLDGKWDNQLWLWSLTLREKRCDLIIRLVTA